MKVLALNSSPRTGHESKTEMMLGALVDGMRQAGAEVELVELRKKKINYCSGCFTCWSKTPGVCIHKDDMTGELFGKWVESDICIYATPLYHYTVNAELKAFLERTLPALEPFMVKEEDGRFTHPLRYGKFPRSVVLSVAGFPHDSVFDGLSHYVNFLFKHASSPLIEIYKAGAEFMGNPGTEEAVADIMAATRQAGQEIVESGEVAPATMERIMHPVMSLDDGARMANMFWHTAIEEQMSPREFDKKGLIPKPREIEDFLLIMPMGFNPEKAGDMASVIQFDFTGDQAGSCYLEIADGTIGTCMGPAPSPDAVITTPFDLWTQVTLGQADASQLFMEGKITATGDLSAVMAMQQVFG